MLAIFPTVALECDRVCAAVVAMMTSQWMARTPLAMSMTAVALLTLMGADPVLLET